jgi:hypothetical protein
MCPLTDDGDKTINSHVNLEYIQWRTKILTDISPECRSYRI